MSSFCEIKKNEFRNQKDFQNAREHISKVNAEKLIKEALYIGTKKSCQKKPNKQILFADDLLEEVHAKIIQSYLEEVKDKTIKEIQQELNKKIEEYIKMVKIILLKSSFEINAYKKVSEKLKKENDNMKQINTSLTKYNHDLLEQIKSYEIKPVHISYDILLRQKEMYDVILKEYSSNSVEAILNEIKMAKEGALKLLDNYNVILKENIEVKDTIKNIEMKYKDKIESLFKEFNEFKEDKENEEKDSNNKIKYLENQLYNNNKYMKENIDLHQILYYIYNLLFEEFSLNKNININQKFLNVKESDFEPNVMYDEEIKNYIELMIKTMHRESMDNIFRECVGYLNLIIRNFFPNKKNLRFKPLETLREINNYLDKNIRKMKNDKILLDEYKNNYIKLEKENVKISKKLSKENDNNEPYQLTNDIQLSADKKNLLNTEKNLNIKETICLTTPIINRTPYNNRINQNNNINLNNISLFSIRKKANLNNKGKSKLIKNPNLFNTGKKLKAFKAFSLNKNAKEKKGFKINKKTRNKSSRIFKSNTIKIDDNNDKILKDNGNNNNIKFINDCNVFIEETNRLFLYQPRMNSYNEKKTMTENDKQEKGKYINANRLKIKNRTINNFFQSGNNEHYEKRVCNKINHLIKNFKNNS